jgi:hypothetical protein
MTALRLTANNSANINNGWMLYKILYWEILYKRRLLFIIAAFYIPIPKNMQQAFCNRRTLEDALKHCDPKVLNKILYNNCVNQIT